MNREQSPIGYDEWMPKPHQERHIIFTNITAENRSLLIKTHVERWLTANRQRLNNEQITVIENIIIPFITPEQYRFDRDTEKVEQEADILQQKAEEFFSREDLMQICSPRADYVPPV